MNIDKTIEALMVLLPPPLGDKELPHLFKIRTDQETMDKLTESESPFAGYLLSCMCDTEEEAEQIYNKWLDKKLKASDF